MTSQAYAQYDQVFIIIRIDASPTDAQAPESVITLVKALWAQDEADAEITRLNQSSHEAGMVYFWKAVRLKRHVAVAPSA